jgi:hypothetical protein
MGKKSKKKKQNQLSIPSPLFSVTFTSVEFIAGHDGLLRGKPEATFAVAVFGLAGGVLTFVARRLISLHPMDGFPFTLKINEELSGNLPSKATALLVLVVAFEEDSAKDVNHFYQFITSMGELQVWRVDEKIPTPVFLSDTLSWPAENELQSHNIEMMHQRKELRELYKGDELIGAGLHWISLESSRVDKSFRSHFVSADKKNDWVLFASVRARN